MRDNSYRAELARRIAQALKYYGGFIYEDDLDDHNTVMDVIRSAGVNLVLSVALLSHKDRRIYVVLPLDKRCRVSCSVTCREKEDCLEKCIDECRGEIVGKIVEALERFADRASRH